MGNRPWFGSLHYQRSKRSGDQFETAVMELIQQHTNAVWRNVRIETLLTQTGSTEMDVVFYSGDTVYILELKRVRRIVGHYERRRWSLYRWTVSEDELSEYTNSNVIEQNNIHARSLLDLYYAAFHDFLKVIPLVIVPDACDVPTDLKHDVLTPSELEGFLMRFSSPGRQDVSYRLSYLLGVSGATSQRSDFVERVTEEGMPVRGRRRI